MIRVLVTLAAVLCLFGPPAPVRGQGQPERVVLLEPSLWRAWKTAFVAADGRVIDNANHGISHSEGQGYGLLLAAFADDKDGFTLLWDWTRKTLGRDDGLSTWRYDPTRQAPKDDPNNASDGDILIAWALVEAFERWGDPTHRDAAARIARMVARRLTAETGLGRVLMPALAGFDRKARPDGPVVNPSYWVYPALPRLASVAGEHDWSRLNDGGLAVLRAARFGPRRLPSEWVSLSDGTAKPARGFEAVYGYNAVRIPLYLVWGGIADREVLAPFLPGPNAPPGLVTVATGQVAEPLLQPGYAAMSAVAACAVDGTRLPAALRGTGMDLYYPSTLRLLALVALAQKHPRCL